MRAPAARARLLAVGVIAFAVVALVVHARAAMGAGRPSLLGGIWLALGRDLDAGVFYRDLVSDSGYGGTRYFPLFFVLIAAFMRGGAGVIASGWLAGAASAAILVAGMYRLARAVGGGRLIAAVFAAAAISPYFVQQTLLEIRADVLAAALNIWGLAFLLPEWGTNPARRARPGWSAVCFTLALATKVTSLAIPTAVLLGALLAGRRALALGVLWRLAIGAALFLLCVNWASDGRAIVSWRACMFGGGDVAGSLRALFGGDVLRLVRYSHLLAALGATTALALVAALASAARAPGRRDDWRAVIVPASVFIGASASAGLALSSPGAVPSNHMAEWVEIGFAVLAFLACTRPALKPALAVVTAGFVVWASAQDVRAAADLRSARAASNAAGQDQALVERVAAAPGPVLSESALWPLLAGRPVYLLDPFALRVVLQSRADIEQDLLAKIDRQMFPLVIFEVDPTTAAGRGFYTHVNFGLPVVERVVRRYRFESHPRPDVYVYVPRAGGRP